MKVTAKALYTAYVDRIAEIVIADGIYKLSDNEVDDLYDQLLRFLPNHGKLYKYRNFKTDSFEKTFDALSQNYIWFASPCCMNDKIDTTVKIDQASEKNKLKSF